VNRTLTVAERLVEVIQLDGTILPRDRNLAERIARILAPEVERMIHNAVVKALRGNRE
jgi:hypothetical protein